MQSTLVCVAWSDRRWQVTESGPRNSIACFGERQDAMDYARELVAHTRDSCLLVREQEQEPELESRSNRQAVRSDLLLERKLMIGPRDGVPARRPTVRS